MAYRSTQVPPYGVNQLYGPEGVQSMIVQPDPALTRSTTAIAVFDGLILMALILFGALALGRFWNSPAHTPTCTSTADQTTVELALLVTNATATDCPLNEGDCTVATAVITEQGNLTLQSDTSLVVGYYTSVCTTVGTSAETDDATDRLCEVVLQLNGEGGLDAGMLTLTGLKTVADEDATDVTFPDPFSIDGGVSNYAQPIGGELTLAYNATTTELTFTGSAIFVN
jgi:phosphohistidine swiveling domain-containing protein